MIRPEIMLQASPACLGNGIHHAVGADRDDAVDRLRIAPRRHQPLVQSGIGLGDMRDKRAIQRTRPSRS
jgi:hypothetical protein